MISHFFIDRPIFASVLSVVIVLTGGIALLWLPIAQYPEITPPSIQVAINYPGANAQVVADTVAAPVEQQVNGVQGMLYMSSQAGNDGSYTLTVTFDLGTDLNTALVMVQNRVALAMPQLPDSVQQQGITIRKKTPDILMVVNFVSPDHRYDDIYLSNYATINIKDELLRVDGVSDINLLGQRDYSIRAWLDPQKLASYNISANDVANAIRDQNIEAPVGQLGQAPADPVQPFNLPIDTLGRLVDVKQFGDIIIKVNRNGPALHPAGMQNGPAGGVNASGISSNVSLGSNNAAMPGGNSSIGNAGSPGPTGTTTSGGSTLNTMLNGLLAISSAANPNVGGINGSTGMLSTAGPGRSAVPGAASSATGSAASGTSPAGDSTSAPQNDDTTNVPAQIRITGIGLTGFTMPLTGMVGMSTTGAGTMGAGAPGTVASGPGPNGAGTGAGSSSISSNPSTAGTTSSAPSGDSTNVRAGGTVGGAALSGGDMSRGAPSPSSSIVRLRDVARIERGAQNYGLICTFDGEPSVGLAIHQLPGTNALDVAEGVRNKLEALQTRFPEGIEYRIGYDITPFVSESVTDVVRTLIEAIVLVAIVVLLFLQNWRAAIIPLVAVPVAIIGTFAIMAVFEFSLNNISLFGLVLAIGIVVDDAIVVVENVERWLEQGLTPREAARRAMDEVTGPVIAVGLVLCAVFVPCAFISGITGQFFRQFAVTVAVSTVFSAINSLTLSPALAAILLKPRDQQRDPLTRVLDFLLGWLFRLFNWAFEVGTSLYSKVVSLMLRGRFLVLLVYAGLLVLTWWVFAVAPTGFVPDQDQGRLIVNIQLPDSASLQRTQATLALVDKIARETPGVAHTVTISGLSFVQGVNSSNFGSMFVVLDAFEDRKTPQLTANAIMARMRREYARQVKDGEILVFGAPPIPGLSVASGFKIMVEDRSGLGLAALQRETDKVVTALRKDPSFSGVFTQFRYNTPQLYMDVDRTKVASLGVSLDDVNQAMQIYLGSLYVNSYNEFGRYWQVTLQAEGKYRTRVSDVNLLQVRNRQGQMVPLGTLVSMRDISGPVMVNRYNLYTAAPITGNIRTGISSGEAIASIDRLASATLPRTMATDWTELMFMQIKAGNTAIYVFFLAVTFVFLALAALYESWSLPLAVILVVPLCLLCSIGGVLLTHMSVDIFVQIGLVVLVGLACKNAILIVEFAQHLHREGQPRFEATVEASRLRLRPILMTSLAFILGVLPLVIASGAGAEMRQSLGTAVFSGMLGVTIFGIFLTPVFFYVVEGLSEMRILTHASVRWIGSACLGMAVGLTSGFLIARVREVPWPWTMVAVSAGAGLLGGLLLPIRWKTPDRLPRRGGRRADETNPGRAPHRERDGEDHVEDQP